MKLPEHFYKEIAQKLGINVKIVEKANKYYWRYGVREAMSSGKHGAVFVKGIGTFYATKPKTYKQIRKYINLAKSAKINSVIKETTREQRLEQCNSRLKELLSLRNKIAIRIDKRYKNIGAKIKRRNELKASGISEND